ncbi:MAG: terpene cyclase/mutase family protein [Planctomycetes bacterium]|nr:terpene cyclase/mutase family protein [Planctomycetota bacterium]
MSPRPLLHAALSLTLATSALAGDPAGQQGGDARATKALPAAPDGTLPLMHPDEQDKGAKAVESGLLWLARHQDAEGFWSTRTFDDHCAGKECSGEGEKGNNVAVTGLALLAFLGAGHTHLSKELVADPHTDKAVRFGEVVKRGLKWLMTRQDQDGCFANRGGMRMMYHHAVATLALCEAYGLTESQLFKRSAQSGLEFIAEGQNPGKGWRYTPKCGDNDTSVTGWCVMALRSGDVSGLNAPNRCFRGALAWVREVTDEDYGRVGYTAKGTGKVMILGKNEDWEHHETMTAMGMLVRTFVDPKGEKATIEAGAKLLVADVPEDARFKVDSYYWYYGSLALYQFDGPDGKHWKNWNKALRTALHSSQVDDDDSCSDGSWDVAPDRWAFEGGRAYATAMGVLALEVSYRLQAEFPGPKKK